MNQVIVTSTTTPLYYDLTEFENFHSIDMEPLLVKSILVGDNLNVYGNTIMNYEGSNQTNYLHFSSGNHKLDPPVKFTSFHIDKKNKI